MLSRRSFVATAAFGFTGSTLFPFSQQAWAVDESELLKSGPLGEHTLGNKDAKVIVIEYASLTCGACKHFHENTFPAFKEKYINTGKVHFILRQFNRDPRDTAAYMLAHCVGDEKYFDFIDLLLETQDEWARGNDPVGILQNLSKQVGFSQAEFEECLTNQELLDGVNWVRNRASGEFSVRSTPTFFIGGEMVTGAISFDQLEEVLNKYL